MTQQQAEHQIRVLHNWVRLTELQRPGDWANILDARDAIHQYLSQRGELSESINIELASIDQQLNQWALLIIAAMDQAARTLPPDHWALAFRKAHQPTPP